MPVVTHASGDVDQARAFLGEYYYSSFIDVLSWKHRRQTRFDVTPSDELASLLDAPGPPHAHEQLRQADPAMHSVTDIAHRAGFTHMGRFAADYRARYEVSPRETLRG